MPKELAHIIKDLEKGHGEKSVLVFLEFLKEKNLLSLLPEVIDYLERMAHQEEKTHTLTIRSPFALGARVLKKIGSFAGAGKDTPVAYLHDLSLIGGFVAEHNFMYFDGSVRRELAQLRYILGH